MDADFLLIKRMKQGDEDAFDVFIRRYYGDILRYCAYRCADTGCAEDLTQETFVRFFEKLSDYRHMGKAKNYLYTIAGNLCRNEYKRQTGVPMEEESLAREMTLGNDADMVIDRVMMEWAIAQLPQEQQEVIDLYYFREMKLREIAAALLAGLWMLLPLAESEAYICRTLGIGGTLFMILMIPELWKNRSNQCMEVETAAYYDLRRVYAARMLLFGGADVLLITAFGSAAVISLQISLEELLIQFLFPVTVTACICFGALGSRHLLSEASAVGMCILWSAVWWCILMNERVYALLTIPVWGVLLAGAAVFLIFVVCRAIRQCGSIWEVSPDGTEIE